MKRVILFEKLFLTKKAFSIEELSQYNGITNPQVYVAIKDIVFDVSISRKLIFWKQTKKLIAKYKPGASYACLAGKDITIALAKMSFEDQYMNVYHRVKLTKAEMETMEGWYKYLKERYQVVGQIGSSKRDD